MVYPAVCGVKSQHHKPDAYHTTHILHTDTWYTCKSHTTHIPTRYILYTSTWHTCKLHTIYIPHQVHNIYSTQVYTQTTHQTYTTSGIYYTQTHGILANHTPHTHRAHTTLGTYPATLPICTPHTQLVILPRFSRFRKLTWGPGGKDPKADVQTCPSLFAQLESHD